MGVVPSTLRRQKERHQQVLDTLERTNREAADKEELAKRLSLGSQRKESMNTQKEEDATKKIQETAQEMEDSMIYYVRKKAELSIAIAETRAAETSDVARMEEDEKQLAAIQKEYNDAKETLEQLEDEQTRKRERMVQLNEESQVDKAQAIVVKEKVLRKISGVPRGTAWAGPETMSSSSLDYSAGSGGGGSANMDADGGQEGEQTKMGGGIWDGGGTARPPTAVMLNMRDSTKGMPFWYTEEVVMPMT